ncbi:NifU N-terminal domain-containing protein [Amphibacillus cookii]|uniref:NifU N-terminal domain-containing protein n=1 Tax=Amphibacillus cookii TaxID=767787 RepID=UPI0019599049|nr:NifU N-terminal domain-containing protein [Amphibacillus cookii]MBM7540154.1 outer membrane lipopolysaccharide assembly protein LptE/RlpB [Amphibacillus cookii]
MAVIAEATPNPNAMKFTSNKQIFQGDTSISILPGQASEYEILNQLIALDGVDNVFGYQFFITINKSFDANWDELIPKVEEIMQHHGY